jgi:hypothetical protein
LIHSLTFRTFYWPEYAAHGSPVLMLEDGSAYTDLNKVAAWAALLLVEPQDAGVLKRVTGIADVSSIETVITGFFQKASPAKSSTAADAISSSEPNTPELISIG